MTMHRGAFVWYELMTEDPVAASAFYRALFGWESHGSGIPGEDYTIMTKNGIGAAGVMGIPDEARAKGARPCWLGYVSVGDADSAAAGVVAAGGSILRAPADIPGVGRFAVAADPGGAVFVVFAASMAPPDPVAAAARPGHAGWHELRAADGEAAFTFYAGQYGWTRAEAIDMGPMGIYQLFARDGIAMGGMMTKPPGMPMAHWLFYFNTETIDAAGARVAASGGQVIHGPMQVPGGQWVLHALDPQGALFGLVAPVR